jgi:hypothetical protein
MGLNKMQGVCKREGVLKRTIDRDGSVEMHIKALEGLWTQGKNVGRWLREWGLVADEDLESELEDI